VAVRQRAHLINLETHAPHRQLPRTIQTSPHDLFRVDRVRILIRSNA
jgi:hypothetical protein